MEIVVFWVVFSVVAAVVAAARGRSPVGYLVLSLVLSPLVGLLLVALLPSKADDAGKDARPRVACPQCAELVLPAAVLCPHCKFAVAEHFQTLQAAAQAAYDKRLAERRSKAEERGRRLSRLFGGRRD